MGYGARIKKMRITLREKINNEYFGDSFAYYQEKYDGFSRQQLRFKSQVLWQIMRQDGNLERIQILPNGLLTRLIQENYNNNPIAYYKDKYPGVTRGILKKEAPGLHNLLTNRDLLSRIPIRPTIASTVNKNYGGDFLRYCQKKYPGITRGKLKAKNPGLYKILSQRGLLEEIPRERADFGKDAVECYNTFFKGLTRQDLKLQARGLHTRLVREGKIDCVPTKSLEQISREALERSKYGVDSYKYYLEHYKGYTRGQLKEANPSFYTRMRLDDTIKKVPKLRR